MFSRTLLADPLGNGSKATLPSGKDRFGADGRDQSESYAGNRTLGAPREGDYDEGVAGSLRGFVPSSLAC